jgi:hypothetical protein
LGTQDLAVYTAANWPGFQLAKHHEIVIEKLEAVRRGETSRIYEESCSRPNWMEKSRLITRRNRATVNHILGAFRVRWSSLRCVLRETR